MNKAEFIDAVAAYTNRGIGVMGRAPVSDTKVDNSIDRKYAGITLHKSSKNLLGICGFGGSPAGVQEV